MTSNKTVSPFCNPCQRNCIAKTVFPVLEDKQKMVLELESIPA